MSRFMIKSILLALLLVAAVLLAACGSSAEKLNNRGNKAFEREEYAEALVNYQRAQVEAPGLAQAYYNAANTFYRAGDFGSALQQLHVALTLSADQKVVENSLFNIGNSHFNNQNLLAAVDSYRQALMLDPSDMDAKYNLELALQTQQQQQEQQEQQDQSGDGEDQQQSQEEEEQKPEEEQGQSEQPDQSEEQDQSQEGEQQSEQQPPSQPQPSQVPQPGEKMTEEQARQLLAAIGKNTDTLQERLGMILMATGRPPVQDW